MGNRGARGRPKLQGSHKFSHKMPMVRAYCSSPQTAFAQGHHTCKCKEVCGKAGDGAACWAKQQYASYTWSYCCLMVEVHFADQNRNRQPAVLQMTSKILNFTSRSLAACLIELPKSSPTPGHTSYGFQDSPAL